MLTSSSSVVLFCPTIPITDQARRYGSWPSPSSPSLSNLGLGAPPTVSTTAAAATVAVGNGKNIGDCSCSSLSTPNLPTTITSSAAVKADLPPLVSSTAATLLCSHHRQTTAAASLTSNSLDHSSMSDVHMCPYPRRGLLSTSACPTTAEGPTASAASNSANVNRKRTPPANTAAAAATGSSAAAAGTAACSSSCNAGKTMDNNYSLDLERITNTVNKLETSGWYYGKLSWQQATDMLRSTPIGTFLMRDSSDPQYLFALSVQTERGPTSIRIHYSNGQFKLDAEDLIAGRMPLFDCVVKLVEYYVKLSQTDKAKAHVWLDDSGRRDRQIRLNTPLYHNVPQLQHLCRLVINGQVPMQRINELQQLPNALKMYIRDYPYQR